MVNSFLILVDDKNIIEMPSLFFKNKKRVNLKYKFYTQLLSGAMLSFYSIAFYETGVSYLATHLLAVVITYIAID